LNPKTKERGALIHAPKYYVQNSGTIKFEVHVGATAKMYLGKVHVYLIHCFEQGPKNHSDFKQNFFLD
jgi:hypothetical protein